MTDKKLKRMKAAIQKYQYLIRRLHEVDVSADREFQRVFNGFFRMGRRTEDFYNDFYRYMEENKHGEIVFQDALSYFYENHHRLEMSFVSKMVALVDPSCPIWDSVVTLGHFGIKAPYVNAKNRF